MGCEQAYWKTCTIIRSLEIRDDHRSNTVSRQNNMVNIATKLRNRLADCLRYFKIFRVYKINSILHPLQDEDD